jgi:MOSC domain-containing protein YiiM
MKVISTNIGTPKTIGYKGKKVTTGIFKYPVKEPIYLGKEDVNKDHVIDRKYHGGVDKACYLYATNHYDYWQKLYPELELPWGMFGENLTIEGLHEADVNIGDIFKVGPATIQATQPRQPCFKLEFRFNDNQIVRKFVESGFSGVYVRVLENGVVKIDDPFVLIEKRETLSVKKVYELLYSSTFDPAVKKAFEIPEMAESCKKDLLKRWGNHM